MNDSPEQEIPLRVTEELKRHWQIFNGHTERKGRKEMPDDLKEYSILVDRRSEDESLFTGDEILILKLNEPLEDLMGTEAGTLKTAEGEEWIQIRVFPKNPYHPILGIQTVGKTDFYYTEELIIHLSNQGRAFEATTWAAFLEPDMHSVQYPHFSYLKRYPQPEEIQVRFTEEPAELTEPFQLLKGQNLERLGFLSMKLRTGDIIEGWNQDRSPYLHSYYKNHIM